MSTVTTSIEQSTHEANLGMAQLMLNAEIQVWQNTYFMLVQQTNADFDVAMDAADKALDRFREVFDEPEEEIVSH